MSFEQEYMHGYIKYEEHFNKMAQKAYPVMGNITQCGFFEFDSKGYAFLAANRPDFGEKFIEKKIYKNHPHIIYGNAVDDKIVPYFASDHQQMMYDKDLLIFGKSFNLKHGFLYTKKLNDIDSTYRMYIFTSDNNQIYNALINDLDLVKKFIDYFTAESHDVIKYYRENKFNLASQRDDYFDNPEHISSSKKSKLIKLLQNFGKLEINVNISDREWQCFELYCHGKSASQTAELLGISRRTVETHFDNLKNKLQIRNKSDLIDCLT
jgi:hypothetical protein